MIGVVGVGYYVAFLIFSVTRSEPDDNHVVSGTAKKSDDLEGSESFF